MVQRVQETSVQNRDGTLARIMNRLPTAINQMAAEHSPRKFPYRWSQGGPLRSRSSNMGA